MSVPPPPPAFSPIIAPRARREDASTQTEARSLFTNLPVDRSTAVNNIPYTVHPTMDDACIWVALQATVLNDDIFDTIEESSAFALDVYKTYKRYYTDVLLVEMGVKDPTDETRFVQDGVLEYLRSGGTTSNWINRWANAQQSDASDNDADDEEEDDEENLIDQAIEDRLAELQMTGMIPPARNLARRATSTTYFMREPQSSSSEADNSDSDYTMSTTDTEQKAQNLVDVIDLTLDSE
ncbi:MAG: hypothetical protein [Atripovirus timinis]|uniref:Uncharacterized protein n=1 Tax=Cressdnaviricota sp. TaxID=2748378 RepID=A0A345MXV4_9VIRU|nr:MAG: hypothetical protein [Cressdnaviricota sp.]